MSIKIRVAVVIVENNRILTMQYKYSDRDVYNLPGGNLELGEKLSDALAREMREELGIEVAIGHLLLVGEVHLTASQKQTLHIIYEGKILVGKPILNPKETSALAIRWIDIKELADNHLYPNVTVALKQYFDGNLVNKYIGIIDQQWF